MNDSANSGVKSLAVSLWGGGHRATLFVLGALMYLVDAKVNGTGYPLHEILSRCWIAKGI